MDNPGHNSDETTDEQQSSCGCCHGGADEATTPAGPGEDTADEQSTTADAEEDAALSDDAEATEHTQDDDLASQLAERTEDLQRVTAEYANFRRRTERDRAMVIATAKSSVVTDFLPVIDDLDLAKSHGDLTGALKAINDKLLAAFDKLGVTRIGAEGEEFNPELHEAVQDLSESDTKVIGTVLRPGFMIGDKLVRTAMVIIADPQPVDEADTK